MPARFGLVLLLFCAASPALAQSAAGPAPHNDQQRLGQRLVIQHCSLCHVRASITSNETVAPPLNKESGGGRDDTLREVISNGTPRMPGFKYQFAPDQIDAIIAHLKTVPAAGGQSETSGRTP